MRVYAYHNEETGKVRYNLEPKAQWHNETQGDSYPVLPIENWDVNDNLNDVCMVYKGETCIPCKLPGFEQWLIAGNEYGPMLAIFANSLDDAYEEFLAYLVTLPGYQDETPDNEEDEQLGQWIDGGVWLSECTLSYLWMHEAQPADFAMAFNPDNR